MKPIYWCKLVAIFGDLVLEIKNFKKSKIYIKIQYISFYLGSTTTSTMSAGEVGRDKWMDGCNYLIVKHLKVNASLTPNSPCACCVLRQGQILSLGFTKQISQPVTEILEIKPSWSLIWTALYESVKKRDAITHVSGVLTGITHFLFKGSAAWRIMRHWNNRIGSKREKKKMLFFLAPWPLILA